MTVSHAIVMAGPDGRITYWDEGAHSLFGYRPDEVVGRRVDMIVPEEYRSRHWEGFDRVMAGGERHLEGAAINLPVRLRDGQVVAFPARFIHLLGPRGQMVGAMGVFAERSGDEHPWSPIDQRRQPRELRGVPVDRGVQQCR